MVAPRALSSRVKRQHREADYSPPNQCRDQENVDLYIHCPMRLHGVVTHRNKFTSLYMVYDSVV
jgi:hypothetical protein